MLDKRGLKVSGTKEELARRFLRDWKKEGRNNYDLLMFLDYERLFQICEDYDLEMSLYRDYTNKELIEKIKNAQLLGKPDVTENSIDEQATADPARPAGKYSAQAEQSSKKVFVVHGRNHAHKDELARIIEELGLEPLILEEQANSGMTLIEKIENHSNDVNYAFVLLTPEDVGSLTGEDLNQRARQNVIFELGYLMGKLGRDRVTCLHTGKIELPTDIQGIAYMPFHSRVEECYRGILRELRMARYDV